MKEFLKATALALGCILTTAILTIVIIILVIG